jgi:uncharacterized protein (TIGR03085 family)
MATPARREREQLCDLFVEVGPDAPTLCGDWTTRDLAAHLVVRERRPDAALGILAKPLAAYGEKVRQHEAQRDYAELVERVRSGPPLLSPMRQAQVERVVNTVEFYVHHEDVRRASGSWTARDLDDDLVADLYRTLSRGARLLARSSPVGLVFEADGHDAIVAKTSKDAAPSVIVSGPVGELVLFAYGRQSHSIVDLAGSDDAIDAVRTAAFGT